mmetsp:Transcript_13725/g.31706  ORF Transcript_13725/g.31706 Transcript_13725/m.31706 type:complete len:237 (+) Transcript_13725:344-1054(+)
MTIQSSLSCTPRRIPCTKPSRTCSRCWATASASRLTAATTPLAAPGGAVGRGSPGCRPRVDNCRYCASAWANQICAWARTRSRSVSTSQLSLRDTLAAARVRRGSRAAHANLQISHHSVALSRRTPPAVSVGSMGSEGSGITPGGSEPPPLSTSSSGRSAIGGSFDRMVAARSRRLARSTPLASRPCSTSSSALSSPRSGAWYRDILSTSFLYSGCSCASRGRTRPVLACASSVPL